MPFWCVYRRFIEQVCSVNSSVEVARILSPFQASLLSCHVSGREKLRMFFSQLSRFQFVFMLLYRRIHRKAVSDQLGIGQDIIQNLNENYYALNFRTSVGQHRVGMGERA